MCFDSESKSILFSTGGSATVANVLLRAIGAYGATWPHERQLMAQSCKLLKALGRPRQW
jgi:hypothetical protein